MPEPPKTLPADFFDRQTQEPPKTLPADFFNQPSSSAATGSQAPIPRTLGDSASDFAGAAFSKVNPVTAISGMAQAATHPIDTAVGMLSAQGKLASEAHDAFKKGDYFTGGRKAVEWLIPIMGPELSAAGDKMAEGRIAEGLGDTAGLAASMFLPGALGRIASKARAVAPSARAAAGAVAGSRLAQDVVNSVPVAGPIGKKVMETVAEAARAEAFAKRAADAGKAARYSSALEPAGISMAEREALSQTRRAGATPSQVTGPELPAQGPIERPALRPRLVHPVAPEPIQMPARGVPEQITQAAPKPIAVTEPIVRKVVSPTDTTATDPGYVYHATNAERLADIEASGSIKPHKPWHGTEQDVWPDGSTESRSYWSRKADVVWSFAPEDGQAVILRSKESPALFKRESTGDMYSPGRIPTSQVEVLTDAGWVPLGAKPKAAPKPRAANLGPSLAAETEAEATARMRQQNRGFWDQSSKRDNPQASKTYAESTPQLVEGSDLRVARYFQEQGITASRLKELSTKDPLWGKVAEAVGVDEPKIAKTRVIFELGRLLREAKAQ